VCSACHLTTSLHREYHENTNEINYVAEKKICYLKLEKKACTSKFDIFSRVGYTVYRYFSEYIICSVLFSQIISVID
jgi:hypothetical protein